MLRILMAIHTYQKYRRLFTMYINNNENTKCTKCACNLHTFVYNGIYIYVCKSILCFKFHFSIDITQMSHCGPNNISRIRPFSNLSRNGSERQQLAKYVVHKQIQDTSQLDTFLPL